MTEQTLVQRLRQQSWCGPLHTEAADEIERLRAALAFYADPTRYQGSNQRNDSDDPWSKGAPYIKDVMRDCGNIARDAMRGGEQHGREEGK